MALLQKRKKVKSYADILSERMLDRIILLVEEENQKPIGFTSSGEPISKEQALKTLRKRSAEVKKGRTISHEEIKKKFAKK